MKIEQLNQSKETVEKYHQLLEDFPNRYDLYFKIAELYAQQKLFAEAIKYYQKAIELNLNHLWSWRGLGDALLEKGDLNNSLTAFLRVSDLDPQYFHAQYRLADIFKQKGDLENAIFHFQKALEIQPDSSYAQKSLQICLDLQAESNKKYLKRSTFSEKISAIYQLAHQSSLLEKLNCRIDENFDIYQVKQLSATINNRILQKQISITEFKNEIDFIYSLINDYPELTCWFFLRLAPAFSFLCSTVNGQNVWSDVLLKCYKFYDQKNKTIQKKVLKLMQNDVSFNDHVNNLLNSLKPKISQKLLEQKYYQSKVIAYEYLFKVDESIIASKSTHRSIKSLKQTTVPPISIHTVQDCFLMHRGRMLLGFDSSGAVIDELTNDMGRQVEIDRNFLDQALNNNLFVAEEVFWVGGKYSVNAYAHFILDCIPRILIGIKSISNNCKIALEKYNNSYVPFFLPYLEIPEPYQLDYSYSVFRFANLSFLNTSVKDHFHPLQLGHPYVIEELKKFKTKLIPNTITSKKNIYLTRRNERGRKIENEAELMPILAEFDFEIVDTSTLSNKEQIEIFASAETIVGIHGGALSNIIFCDSKSKILELFPPTGGSTSFFVTAQSLGLEYYHLVGQSTSNREVAPNFSNIENFILNPDEFRDTLRQILT